ncbi:MAG: hypothetical protein FWC91_12445 [Defluviitaleaceae bacterium]|nr:hypothetical protein [Defluviitaleaceae bacterium]
MKKKKILIITIISISLFFILNIILYIIEDNIEANAFNLIIQNTLYYDISMSINGNVINVSGRTELWDKIIFRNLANINTFKIKIKNEDKIIFERTGIFSIEEVASFSARGGLFSNVIISKNEYAEYIIIFSIFDPPINESLYRIRRRRFVDIFNRDGLNML